MDRKWFELGAAALNDGAFGNEMLPFAWWKEVGWKQTFQYPVEDFLTEVGFYLDVFGFQAASLSEDYALLTTPVEDFAFSIASIDTQPNLGLLRLQFFTDKLNGLISEIKERGCEPNVYEGSPGQRVIGLTSPAGLPIEIWSGFEG